MSPRVHRDLAWALRQQAQRAGEQAPSVRGSDWRQAVVTAVGTDGTVDADGIPAIRCLQSYLAPAVGDVIVISQSSTGNWVAHGRLTPATPAWIPLQLASGWTANAAYYTPAYRLWGDGTASLCGLAQTTGTLTSGATVATLPVEARPAAGVRVAVQVAIGIFGAMTISTNGAIQVGDFSGTIPTGNKYAEFDAFGRYRLK